MGGKKQVDIKLTYFLVVAEEKSITRAANKLFISQQCLSRHMASLEREYNAILFTRKPNFALTGAGRYLVRKAQEMERLETHTKTEVNALGHEYVFDFTVGFDHDSFLAICPEVISDFFQQAPSVNLDVIHKSQERLFQECLDGTISLYAGEFQTEDSRLYSTELCNEYTFVVISKHQLYNLYGEDFLSVSERLSRGIHLEELRGISFIGQHRSSLWSSEYLREFLLREEKNMHYNMSTDNVYAKVACVAEGIFAGFVPSLFIPSLRKLFFNNGNNGEKSLFFFPVLGVPPVKFGVHWLKDHSLSKDEDIFVQCLKQCCKERENELRQDYPIIKSVSTDAKKKRRST